MKKIISMGLILMIVLSLIPTGILAKEIERTSDLSDVLVKETDVDRNRIRKGDVFTLTLTLKSIADEEVKEEVKSVYIKLLQSNAFSLVGSGSTKEATGFNKAQPKSGKVSFKLRYDGSGETQLPINITYVKGNNSYSVNDYVSIAEAERYEEPEKTEPKDPEPAGEPIITIIDDKTTVGEQGERVNVSFKIKNNSDADAYNISASADLSESSDGLYIDGSGYDDVSRLGSGKTKNMSFRININDFAEDKTYPIKVNFHYNNDDDKHFTTSDTLYVKVQGDGNDRQVIIDDVFLDPDENIKPGMVIKVGIRIKNLSIVPARDVQISLEGLERDKFSLASGVNKRSLRLVTGRKTEYIEFPVRISQKLKAGNHELNAKLTYKNLRGQVLEDESLFFIPLKGESAQKSSLIIEEVKSPSLLKAEKDGTISFKLRNRGNTIARDIIISSELPDSGGLVPKSVSTLKLDYIEPGESEDIAFIFHATKSAETKNYPINIKVTHVDDFSEGDERYELDQFFGIFVDNPEKDDKTSTPKLIIDRYDFSSNMVEAGENFQMNLSFYNTNRNKSVQNIKIFLTAEPNVGNDPDSPNAGSSVFTPVNSSNTFYIDSIPPKGRVQKSITMFTVPDAKAKTHIITANFEYEDSEFNEYKAEELIGVPVVQQSRLEIGELQYEKDAYAYMEHPISVEFYNTGKVTLYNMMVKLEGDFQTETSRYYVGNFAMGTSESFEGYITPDKEGPLEGEIVFTYEDSQGKPQEVRETFSLNVMADMEPDFPDGFEDPIEEPGFFNKNKKWLIPLFIGGGGFGAFKFYKKRKEKKEEEDLLSDE